MIQNDGLDHIVNQLIQPSGYTNTPLAYLGIGTSNAANTAGMNDLTAPLSGRVPITYKYLESVGKAHCDTFVDANTWAGVWAEVMLFTASSGTNGKCRKVLATTFTKINSPNAGANTALVAFTITFTNTGV